MFWKRWSEINEYEKKGIGAVKDFVKKIVKEHEEKIHSIFAHGTFARREYVKHSDVDITVIVYKNKDIEAVDKFCKDYKQTNDGPCVSAKARSIEELKTGLLAAKGRVGPKRLITLLKTYELVWGKQIDYDELLPENPPAEDLKNIIQYILSQEKENRSNIELAKLYCWVVWFDNRHLGIKREFSYKAIKEQFQPESLAYQAVLVWETSGEYVPKNFRKKIFDDLRERLVELIEETD